MNTLYQDVQHFIWFQYISNPQNARKILIEVLNSIAAKIQITYEMDLSSESKFRSAITNQHEHSIDSQWLIMILYSQLCEM